jgi:hypothetical protein
MHVIARATIECVITIEPSQDIIALKAGDRIGIRRTGQDVVARGARNICHSLPSHW